MPDKHQGYTMMWRQTGYHCIPVSYRPKQILLCIYHRVCPRRRNTRHKSATSRRRSMRISRKSAGSCSKYNLLTMPSTNVPAVAMSFSDRPFPYGPFVPHWVPKQYIENYFSCHRTDSLLVMNTSVENVSMLPARESHARDRWELTLRRFDSAQNRDMWWIETFDALIIANGHYSVPFVGV